MPRATDRNDSSKPPYRVPSMAEINVIPWNGFTVASTFSGCGGSSLGYRMAGFRVLWASEFVAAARDSYRANMSPGTILDERDIREVTPESMLAAMKMRVGQLDLLDGSPPCASFSTAGKRQKHWGQEKKYSDTKQRTDDLFFEFVRLLNGIQPRTFVAENVSGLVKGTAKGYFLEILAALKAAGYRVACRVLDAQWLGVPQQRQRAIFIGVRNDLQDAAGKPLIPCHPSPLPYRYSVREAIPWIARAVQDTGSDSPGFNGKKDEDFTVGCAPTVRAAGKGQLFVEKEVEVFEDTFKEHRTYTDGAAPSIRARKPGHLGVGHVVGTASNSSHERTIKPLSEPSGTICAAGPSDESGKFIVEPEADMTGKATGAEFDRMGSPGTQSERYFQLVRPALGDACPTVTAAGGNAGLASVCHPIERRKFSIAELKRICAFPDDFVLTGSYAQQWERLGRAVPPMMMRAIAEAVRDGMLRKMR